MFPRKLLACILFLLISVSLAFGSIALQTPRGWRDYNVPKWDPTCHPAYCRLKIDAACQGNDSWSISGGVVDFGFGPVFCEGRCANGMTITFNCPKNRRVPIEV